MSSHSKSLFSSKKAIHLVFKSEIAYGWVAWSMLRTHNKIYIEKLAQELSEKYQIKIYQMANVGNHIHLLIKCGSRENYIKFLREFPSKIALYIAKSRKGASQGKFWSEKIFSRLVHWGKDFSHCSFYLLENIIEGIFVFKKVLKGYEILEGRKNFFWTTQGSQ